MPAREVYWNIINHNLIYLLLLVTLFIFLYGVGGQIRALMKGKKQTGLVKDLLKGLNVLWQEGLKQKRIRRDTLAGYMHLFLFWGFSVLFVGTLIVALQADFGIRVLVGQFYLWFSLALDLAGLLALIGVVGLVYRRVVVRPAGLSAVTEDWVLLVFIAFILITGFLVEGVRQAATADPWTLWSPVGFLFSMMFRSLGVNLPETHRILWWLHLILGMGFLAYLPFGKITHLLFAPLNILLSANRETGKILTLDVNTPSPFFGAGRIEGFTPKQIIESSACTRCGRCEQGCPAFLTHKPLSPKELNNTLMDFFTAKGLTGEKVFAPFGPLTPETIWACTTCGYCENECPVLIDQVSRTVEMRRSLVLEEGRVPDEMRQVLRNLDKQGNPWGEWRGSRGLWAQAAAVPLLKDKGKTDVLFWVGCMGSFDERSQQISGAVIKLLQASQVDFAILGDEENCCGDAVRRVGEEYLFQKLARENIKTMEKYGVKKIITACPHCYQTLKSDYGSQMGAKFEVRHYTEFVAELLQTGSLQSTRDLNKSVTYHDPCYLGRYNNIYEAPRQVLNSIPGLELTEMERNRDKSFCCGAGSGHMWMDEGAGERINHVRAQEAMDTGARTVVTSCPFCLTMMEDGTRANASEVEVIDLAELVAKTI
ncbi:MAG: heterodisulfide reductase-related iron-sulfur binding cluster [Desulfitobacteriaceae bacterium]